MQLKKMEKCEQMFCPISLNHWELNMISIVKPLKRVPLAFGCLLMGIFRGAIKEMQRSHNDLHTKHPRADEFPLVWQAYFAPLTGGYEGMKKEIKSLRKE